jgi:hypothetical protein
MIELQALSPFTYYQSGCLRLGKACPVQGLLHVDGSRTMRMASYLALTCSRPHPALLRNMGGYLAILLSLLGFLYSVASSPLPALGARAVSSNSSDCACFELDKSGYALSHGSADSSPGNVTVYSCVYSQGINCQYFVSVRASAPYGSLPPDARTQDGTLYREVDPSCPWKLKSIAGPPSYNILRCAMKDPSGHAVSYTNPSVLYNGRTVYACAYNGGTTQCKYLLVGAHLSRGDGQLTDRGRRVVAYWRRARALVRQISCQKLCPRAVTTAVTSLRLPPRRRTLRLLRPLSPSLSSNRSRHRLQTL